MAKFMCKMCGGDIEGLNDQSFATCESCHTTTTLPRVDDDQRAAVYNRATQFRRQKNYDAAMKMYQKMVEADDSQAEAHWGIILCRYGIDYVVEASTNLRIPICTRVNDESILQDVNYLAALHHAQNDQTRSLYRDEAHFIASLQKEQFDKDEAEKTDLENKSSEKKEVSLFPKTEKASTNASVLKATGKNNHAMIESGYKFLGEEDWASAEAHFDRVLDIDPCHTLANLGKFCVAERLSRPEQMAHDIRYIRPPQNPYYQRAMRFAEPALQNRLNRLIAKSFEQKLNQDYEKGMELKEIANTNLEFQAVANLFAGLKGFKDAPHQAKLCRDAGYEIDYQIALVAKSEAVASTDFLAVAKLFSALNDYRDAPKETRICQETGYEMDYQVAISKYKNAKTAQEYRVVAKLFQKLDAYRDSANLATRAIESAIEADYQMAVAAKPKATTAEEFQKLHICFASLGDYKDAAEYAETCQEESLHVIYQEGMLLKAQRNYSQAIGVLEPIAEYRDSKIQVQLCQQMMNGTRNRKMLLVGASIVTLLIGGLLWYFMNAPTM